VIDREAIYSALWEVASQSSRFATVSRRLRHWADVAPAEQPALFMTQRGQMAENRQNVFDIQPPIYTLEAQFYIYVHSEDPYTSPAILLNPLLDALEWSLRADPVSGVNDLGLPEMVHWVRINGRIETAEGVLGDQEVAIVPVEIRCI
jgi:hypothetical protein